MCFREVVLGRNITTYSVLADLFFRVSFNCDLLKFFAEEEFIFFSSEDFFFAAAIDRFLFRFLKFCFLNSLKIGIPMGYYGV